MRGTLGQPLALVPRISFALLLAVWIPGSSLVAFGLSEPTQTATATPVASPDAAPSTFEVASIRRANPDGEPSVQSTLDGFRSINLPLTVLLRSAYAPTGSGDSGFFRLDRMAGIPEWLADERYDVTAKIPDSDLTAWKSPARQQEMLRAMLSRLLEERCKLVVHRGIKEMPVYSLTVMKNGPKIKPAQTTDITELGKLHPGASIMPGGFTIDHLPGPPPHFEYFSTSMAALALQLAAVAGRPIEDKTGLPGKYDFSLQYAGPGAHSQTDDSPSIFTAVEEQLGLKLVSQNGWVETLVIDHVERPSEN